MDEKEIMSALNAQTRYLKDMRDTLSFFKAIAILGILLYVAFYIVNLMRVAPS